ncbi:MAG: tetratricopeptide repeat protein [Chloroflexi bacterium]|nr:MAG: tetratricopeptide repeat protein [Chloroflexota bacterium]
MRYVRILRAAVLAVWLVAGVAVPAVVLAQNPVTPTQAMEAANKNYEAGEYQQAIDIYQTILDAGIEDSAIYYNLGNAYFKQGDLGRAILNYRRAYRLDPRDSAITANLAIARLQTLDRLDNNTGGGLTNLVQVAEEWLTLREAAMLALFLWLLTSGLLTAAILSRRFRKVALWSAAVTGFFLVAGLFSMANRYYTESTYPAAVVVAREVDVTSGPGTSEQYVVEFNLHAGAEVQVVNIRPNWRQIALPGNDFQGWVPADAVEQVSN